MSKIIRRDETDEAPAFKIRFKGIERYHEYETIKDFVAEWRDYDEYIEKEVKVLEQPKSEARRRIDLFLKELKKVPTKSEKDYYNWKARG